MNNPSAPSNISTVPVPKLDTWIPSVNLSILFQICFRAFSLLQTSQERTTIKVIVVGSGINSVYGWHCGTSQEWLLIITDHYAKRHTLWLKTRGLALLLQTTSLRRRHVWNNYLSFQFLARIFFAAKAAFMERSIVSLANNGEGWKKVQEIMGFFACFWKIIINFLYKSFHRLFSSTSLAVALNEINHLYPHFLHLILRFISQSLTCSFSSIVPLPGMVSKQKS